MAAEGSRPLDPAEFLDALTDLLALSDAGDVEGRAVQRSVDLAAAVTGAAGAVFADHAGAGGRIVAATGSMSWALGHPLDPPAGPHEQSASSAERGQPGDDPDADRFVRLLRGSGMCRGAAGVASVEGVVVGSMHAFFRAPDGGLDAHQTAAMRLLAAAATHLCQEAAQAPARPAPVVPRPEAGPSEQEQARDLFIAVTSHELRTPVTVIKGYADTLVERWDSLADQARRTAVFVLWQRARELARLVDRLLDAASDVAGVRAGSAGMPFDPAVALRDAAAELSVELRRDLTVALPESLPKVRGDRASLATVLNELVTNASKYSPEVVEVELTGGADAQTVWFRVSDRGMGIRPEHAERAFERFWQLETGDQRRYGGVGLGLYLVRRIVERQNGWVSLRPRDGGGTVAEVRLPRVDGASRGID